MEDTQIHAASQPVKDTQTPQASQASKDTHAPRAIINPYAGVGPSILRTLRSILDINNGGDMTPLALQCCRALPTWLRIQLFRPFLPKLHPLNCRMTLMYWVASQTGLARTFDYLFWVSIGCWGFVDREYRFYCRGDAARIAYKLGQFIRKPDTCPESVISEELW